MPDNLPRTADEKPALHATDLRTLSMCPVRYEFRRVKGIIAPPGIAMVVGTGVHKSVEHNMRSKMETGALVGISTLSDITRDSINEAFKQGVMLPKEEAARGAKVLRGEAVDKGVTLSSLHREELAPVIKPVAVERTWRLGLEGYPMDLTGTIDLQEKDAIRDTKTTGKTPPKDVADKSQQLTMYALGARYVDGKLPKKLHLDYLVHLKTPKAKTLTTERTEGDLDLLLRRVESAIRLIEHGSFMPCDPENWWCSAKWCGYYDQCPYVKNPVTVGG